MPWTQQAEWGSKLMRPTWQYDSALERTLRRVPAGVPICDLGAGGRRIRPDTVTVDACAGPEVDVVADLHHLPLPDDSFGLVICTGTLNLCESPDQVVSEMRRIVRPGGLVHVEVGMFQPYNPEPEDYWRFTKPGLAHLMTTHGFEVVTSGSHIGPFSALAAGAVYLGSWLLPGTSITMKAMRGMMHVGFGAMKYMDALVPARLAAATAPIAYGVYFTGAKSASKRTSSGGGWMRRNQRDSSMAQASAGDAEIAIGAAI